MKLLYRCDACQRIWLQDGKRCNLDLGENQVAEIAREVSADLAMLPTCTCRVCLYRAGGGAIEIDEYGKGAGFGFSWEYPSPHLMHAMVTIVSSHWLSRQADPRATLPDIVTRPKKMRAVLIWFAELSSPPSLSALDPDLFNQLDANPPGFGQPGTEHWRWRGGIGVAPCPPLGGPAVLLLAVALPATTPLDVQTFFTTWQSLALLSLQGGIVGEVQPGFPHGNASPQS